jgi:hypothetical protein
MVYGRFSRTSIVLTAAFVQGSQSFRFQVLELRLTLRQHMARGDSCVDYQTLLTSQQICSPHTGHSNTGNQDTIHEIHISAMKRKQKTRMGSAEIDTTPFYAVTIL